MLPHPALYRLRHVQRCEESCMPSVEANGIELFYVKQGAGHP